MTPREGSGVHSRGIQERPGDAALYAAAMAPRHALVLPPPRS
jgi:hypothetical protein